MEDGVFEVGRTIRAYLPALVGDVRAAEVDGRLISMLKRGRAGSPVDDEILELLAETPQTLTWAAAVIGDSQHRPPDLQPVAIRASGPGFSALPSPSGGRPGGRRPVRLPPRQPLRLVEALRGSADSALPGPPGHHASAVTVTKFWEGVAGKLADRWSSVSVAALVFWLGGLLAWAVGHGGVAALQRPAGWLSKQPNTTQIGILLVILIGVAGSGIAVSRLTRPALALLEGYWPGPFRGLRRRMTNRVVRNERVLEVEFVRLAAPVRDGTATPEERERFAAIDRARRRLPAGDRMLPTRIGNTLRACETRPVDKYGLDAVSLWPHLWLLLPENSRSEIASAQRALDTAVAACVWGVLFACFAPLTPWALPVGAVVALLAALVWAPANAEVYADLVEASFDLHRGALYAQLRWPLPDNPRDERAAGRSVTTYLIRGSDALSPTFVTPEPVQPVLSR